MLSLRPDYEDVLGLDLRKENGLGVVQTWGVVGVREDGLTFYVLVLVYLPLAIVPGKGPDAVRGPQSLGFQQLYRKDLLGSGSLLLLPIQGLLLCLLDFLYSLYRALKIPILRRSVHKQFTREKLLIFLYLRHLEYYLLLKILL